MNIFNRFLLKLSGQYRGFETDEELPLLSELYFVGGAGSLRGFRNEQFSALRTANATIEPRIRFNSGFTFAFFDAAYLNNRIMIDDKIQSAQFYRFGYGGGIALVSGEQLINIFFSWNKDIPFDRPWLTVQFISAL